MGPTGGRPPRDAIDPAGAPGGAPPSRPPARRHRRRPSRFDVPGAVRHLPGSQRAAIVLHYYEDRPVAEVATDPRLLRVRQPGSTSIAVASDCASSLARTTMTLDRRLREELQRAAAEAIEPDVERQLGAPWRRGLGRRGGIGGTDWCSSPRPSSSPPCILGVPDRTEHRARRRIQLSRSHRAPRRRRLPPDASGSYPADRRDIHGHAGRRRYRPSRRDELAGTWTMRLLSRAALIDLSPPASVPPGANGLSGIAFSAVR